MKKLILILLFFSLTPSFAIMKNVKPVKKRNAIFNVGYSWFKDSSDNFIDFTIHSNFRITRSIFAFIQLDVALGLEYKMVRFLYGFTPGLSLYECGDVVWWKIDLGFGPSMINTTTRGSQMGLTSMLRFSLGYDFIGLFCQVNYHQFKIGGYERYNAGISLRF